MSAIEALRLHCKALRLPTIGAVLSDTLRQAEQETWAYEILLETLFEQEIEGRRLRRIERLLKQSHLPPNKTLAQFDTARLPLRIQRLLPQLCTGDFVDQAHNLLLFGLPGTGKTQPS
jgi:DNA replication protein DnaC